MMGKVVVVVVVVEAKGGRTDESREQRNFARSNKVEALPHA